MTGLRTTIRAGLHDWYDRWRSNAGVQGRIIPSQAERWRAMRGDQPGSGEPVPGGPAPGALVRSGGGGL